LRYVSRFIFVAMLLGAAYVLIYGPRPEPAVPPGRENDVVIQYWEKWVGPESAAMQRIVDDFNATVGREKHIYVQYLSISGIAQKVLVSIAGGTPPDVAGLWHDWVVLYASLGAVIPLDDLAAGKGITAAYYKPVYWNACHYQGHLYALVSTPGAVALFYNVRIFRENAAKLRAAGLDPDRPPATIAELNRYAQTLETFQTDSAGQRHLDRAGYLPMEPGWYITETPIWFGGSVWENKTQQFTLTDPGVERAFQWMQSYSLRLGRDAVTEFTSQSDTHGGYASMQNPFLAGRIAMEQQGPWMANTIHVFAPSMDNDWAAAPFPSDDPNLRNVTFCPFDALMIPKGCKHPREAFEFIAYVNRQDVMEKLCMSHCKNSPLAKVSDNFLNHHPNRYIRVFEDLAASPNAHGPIPSAVAQQSGRDLQALAQELVGLETDPQTGKIIQPADALGQLQSRLEAQLEDYRARLARRHEASQ
jgi:ABC-type glycerol-3-phosphate transport system substrate-binding protein